MVELVKIRRIANYEMNDFSNNIMRNHGIEEQENLISDGFRVGVFGRNFGWNLTLEGVLRHASRLEY